MSPVKALSLAVICARAMPAYAVPLISSYGPTICNCCWFGNWRAVLCVLPATLLVGFLWVIAVLAL